MRASSTCAGLTANAADRRSTGTGSPATNSRLSTNAANDISDAPFVPGAMLI